MELDPAKFGYQGDAEAPQLLRRLALRNPDVEWVIVGKNDRAGNHGMPPNVTNPWPNEPWFKNGPVQHVDSVNPEKLPSMRSVGPTYVSNSDESLAFEYEITKMIGELDGVVVHLGQHGTSHRPIPEVPSTWDDFFVDWVRNGTNPQAWSRNYGDYLIQGLNALGDRTDGRAPVTWICTDPRNFMKARDVKWTSGLDRILAQHHFERASKHERFRDPRTPRELGVDAKVTRHGELWVHRDSYRHGGLELMILPDDWKTWGSLSFGDRSPVGVASTSYYVERDDWRRSWYVRRYVLDNFPDAPVFGRWDKRSFEDVGGFTITQNQPAQFPDLLGSWRTTVALPVAARSADGIMWTAAKPFQCFAANTVCFMLGQLDRQGWMLPSRQRTPQSHEVADGLWSVRDDWTSDDLDLARWLRVLNPEEYVKRATAASGSEDVWRWLVAAQRDLLRRRWNDHYVERCIEHQQGLT